MTSQMVSGDAGYDSHSANIEMCMVIGDLRLPIRRIGRNNAILRESADVPDGTLVRIEIVVDGIVHPHEVVLVRPLSRDSREASFF